MSDEFSGVDFAVGSVRGFRAWSLDFNGVLSGVSHKDEWLPGENAAQCHGSTKDRKREDEDWSAYSARNEEWRANHEMQDCQHGFYAYFADDNQKSYTKTLGVRGIIEGYGEVLIGTKGFRAMRARILAISYTPHEGMWRLEPLVVQRLRDNYPGVAMFESDLVMQAEFPADISTDYAVALAAN